MQERWTMQVQGIVQGVGFRPFVYNLASRLGLRGMVWNDMAGVMIDVEGEAASLETFRQALVANAPPLAVIEQVAVARQPVQHAAIFAIAASVTKEHTSTLVAPDVAPCAACLAELRTPRERRYGYPFLNCTHCGPRFTIITTLPYDRERTTMHSLRMCAACQAEYDDPADRRFHAQPIACPTCGPRLQGTDAQGHILMADDALNFVGVQLCAGKIIAVKGLGGYHLACDALQEAVVRQLRCRKHRQAKPLAIMVADLEAAQRLCEISPAEAALLTAPQRPIVVLRKTAGCPIAEAVAPGHRHLGVMLPSTPLHSMLLQQVARPVVMTSGNRSEEPIVYKDEEALQQLTGIADYFLTHNRPIQVRCDDSVMRLALGRALPLRRARGYVPLPVRLVQPCARPLLACGGHLKNTFCLARGAHAFLSHHLGDLETYHSYRAFIEGIEHFVKLLAITPTAVAYDLHPGYLSTQYARSRTELPQIAVQHHHAHIASCMTENGCVGPVIGVAWDGTGYGADGNIWGGEFLRVTYAHCERLAHLAAVPLPGGEQAIRQPWRTAVSYLRQVYGDAIQTLDLACLQRWRTHQAWPVLQQMLARGINTPLSSSVGRLFDAVAALVGLGDEVQYEAQAAIQLEMVADDIPGELYPFRLRHDLQPMVLETTELMTAVVERLRHGDTIAHIAAAFHATLAEMIVQTCCQIRQHTGLDEVALSGGVFQNVRLLSESVHRLATRGFTVYTHHLVPPNDGGLALGQAAVASALLA